MRPPRSLSQIRTRLRAKLPALKNRFSIEALGVFGFWARGKVDRSRAVEPLVRFEEEPGLLRYMALERRLSQLLGAPVDLGTPSTLERITHPGGN